MSFHRMLDLIERQARNGNRLNRSQVKSMAMGMD